MPARSPVRLTHPDKLVFPDDGIVKADVAAYYASMAPVLLPHVRDRPLSMQRFRDGIAHDGFYQKELPQGTPQWIKRVRIPKRGGSVCHMLANDRESLVWLAQINAVAFHVFPRRADRLDRPDRLVVDLDPPGDGDFADVRAAARAVGEQLRGVGLEPFAMTTGSKGIHVVAPLRRTRSVAEVMAFADAFAAEAAARDPRRLTTAFHKAERGERIYVDVARNRPAQMAVPPYVLRPRPGAPVATPLRWEELDDPRLRPDGWTLRTVHDRLDVLGGDPWAQIASAARSAPRV